MKILVTGGAGFMGSAFVRFVLGSRAGHGIVNFDKLTYAGNLANVSSVTGDRNYSFVRADICNGEQVLAAMRGCDSVVHFAAESHVDRSIAEPAPAIKTNVEGTLTLLEAARSLGLRRFVHISTDEVYGDVAPGVLADESAPVKPSSPYSASKASGDFLVQSYIRTYRLPAIIVRPSNNYGPFQFPEKFIPVTIVNARDSKLVPIYGDGRQERTWVYVEDTCRGILALLERGRDGEIYNLGGSAVEKNLSLARRILGIMNKPEQLLTHVADRPGHDRRYAMNSAKMERELGWKPATPLDEGLRRTVEWYAANSHWLDEICSRTRNPGKQE